MKIAVIEKGSTVRVEAAGELLTEYHVKDAARPYFYPVIGPTGQNLTRHWPMKKVDHEERDHKHHRGLWFTHGSVNGDDFWTEGRGPRIVHQEFTELSSGETGVIASRSEWRSKDGKVVCTDTRRHVFATGPGWSTVDFEIALHASHGDVTLGDTKEGTMAIRLPPTLRVKGEVAAGTIVNSENQRDGETWGKRAAWCDYNGPLEGERVGVAIFDHPDNIKHPTWWHVRDYGLFAANPFGVHDFERKPPGTGDVTIPAGESLTFKYRVLIHKGDHEAGQVAERYAEYAGR